MNIIDIDGSLFEGGGQILRNSVSLSAITFKPVSITKIRAGRKNPGLSNQHISALKLCAEFCSAPSDEIVARCTEFSFLPQSRIHQNHYQADTGTAGSVCLIAQAAIPVLLFAPNQTTLDLIGGTDAKFAPPVDFFQQILAPYYARFGAHFNVKIIRRGYYPQGGGCVQFQVTNLYEPLLAVTLTDPGRPSAISGVVLIAGNVQMRSAYKLRDMAVDQFKSAFPGLPVNIDVVHENRSVGSVKSFLFWVETSQGYRLSSSHICDQRQDPPECQLISEHVGHLAHLAKIGSCVDDHMQDQLIIMMALAKGCSIVHSGLLTQHTKSAIYVAETMLNVKFHVEEDSERVVISCQGIGHI